MSRMENFQLYHWLRLVYTPGMTFMDAKALLETFGLPENVFSASYLSLMKVVNERLAQQLHSPCAPNFEQKLQQVLQWQLQTKDAEIITIEDPRYPHSFFSIPEPPLVLFARGNLSLLQRPTVALLGTESPNEEGLRTTRLWAAALSKKNHVTLLAGNERGVAAEALSASVRAGGSLIYVTRQALMEDPVANQLPSSFLSLSLTLPGNDFLDEELNEELYRRLFLASSQILVLVQATLRSKPLWFVREALDLNKSVQAIPGSIHSALSKGPNLLIKQGARLVESVEDVLKEAKVDIEP